jgi:hypothetical protein
LEEICNRDKGSAIRQLSVDAEGNSTQPADFLWPSVMTLNALLGAQ